MNPNSDHQRLLRMSLAGNAVFSVLSGLAFALGSSAVASAIGLTPSWTLLVVGIGLLGFAACIVRLPVVMADVLNTTGNVAAVAVAGAVVAFAALQVLGTRRLLRSEA